MVESERVRERPPAQWIVSDITPARSVSKISRHSLLSWVSTLALTSSCGLVIVSLGYSANRAGQSWSQFAFWLGLLLIFTPITARLLSAKAHRLERIGNLVVLTLSLYFVKVLHSPQSFTFYDELLHWRTAEDILLNGTLFTRNPLLPLSALYPGLENLTSAFVSLSGLSVFHAGILIIGVVKLVLIIALFLFFERISRSSHLASLAALFYCTNPAFVFFDAQFGYESLALAFSALILWSEIRRQRSVRSRLSWTIVGLSGVAALIVTHHLSSYLTAVLLLLWTLIPFAYNLGQALLRWYAGLRSTRHFKRILGRELRQLGYAFVGRSGRNIRRLPALTALIIFIGALLWMVFIANIVVAYIGTYVTLGLDQILKLINHDIASRQLFRGYAGEVAPVWEQIVTYLATALILLLLVGGIWVLFRKQRRRLPVMVLVLVAACYPLSLGLHLTDFGLQISSRLVEFLFVGVGFVLAVCTLLLLRSKQRPIFSFLRSFALVAVITIIFVGGVILGWPYWARLPGSYLVVADTRSVESEGLDAAAWMRQYEGAGNSIASDRINAWLLGSYGSQNPLSLSYDAVDVPQMFFAPTWDDSSSSVLTKSQIKFVIGDYRLTHGLPYTGYYFELGEANANQHTSPLATSALDKFDAAPLPTNRLYDSGNLVIWEVVRP